MGKEQKETAEQQKAAAAEQKKAGDKAYGIEDYEAASLDDSDLSFLMKLAKTKFFMRKDMECLHYCQKLIKEADTRGGTTDKEELRTEAILWMGSAKANLATCAEDFDTVITALEPCPSEETKDKLGEAKSIKEMFHEQEQRNKEAAKLRHEGRRLLKRERDKEAKRVLTEAIEKNPWDDKNFRYRAECHINQDEFPEAVEDADRCIKLNPNSGKGYNCKAVAEFRMGNLDNALLTVADCLEHAQGNPDIPGLLRCFTVNCDASAESSRKHVRDTEHPHNELQENKTEPSNEISSLMDYEKKVEELKSRYNQLNKKFQSAQEHADLKHQLEEYNVRYEELRPYFICPISQGVMKYPVIAADGCTYEAQKIMELFESGNTKSPMTRKVLEHKKLIHNDRLHSAIKKWRELRTMTMELQIKLWNITS